MKKDILNHPIEVLPNEKIKVFNSIAEKFGTPLYVYFEEEILRQLKKFQAIPAPFGLIVRYAMKANSTGAILKLLDKNGAHFDASTFNECVRLIEGAEIDGSKIRLTSQEVQTLDNLRYIVENKILYTACSLKQIEEYGKLFPNTEISIRFNIGVGSGHSQKVTTGGKNSSFGIYNKHKEIKELLKKYNLDLVSGHFHIGSGSDPEKQKEAIQVGLGLIKDYPSIKTINMGGGFKFARMQNEKSVDVEEMGNLMSETITEFKKSTGREIALEVEPGAGIVQQAGYILTKIIDKVDTGSGGEKFLKVNGGMNMNIRIPLYGAQHPLIILPSDEAQRENGSYIVMGICCESGDVLTVNVGDGELMSSRKMLKAEIADLMVISGAGAYVSSMAALNYNSQQIHPEILVRVNGDFNLIRERQPLNDLWRYEKIPGDLK